MDEGKAVDHTESEREMLTNDEEEADPATNKNSPLRSKRIAPKRVRSPERERTRKKLVCMTHARTK